MSPIVPKIVGSPCDKDEFEKSGLIRTRVPAVELNFNYTGLTVVIGMCRDSFDYLGTMRHERRFIERKQPWRNCGSLAIAIPKS